MILLWLIFLCYSKTRNKSRHKYQNQEERPTIEQQAKKKSINRNGKSSTRNQKPRFSEKSPNKRSAITNKASNPETYTKPKIQKEINYIDDTEKVSSEIGSTNSRRDESNNILYQENENNKISTNHKKNAKEIIAPTADAVDEDEFPDPVEMDLRNGFFSQYDSNEDDPEAVDMRRYFKYHI